MKQVHEFSGKVAYVSKNGKQFKPDEPMVWTARLYPDAATRKLIKASGLRNEVKEDDGEKSGVEGLFYTFRSRDPYEIVDANDQPLDKLVANNSEGTFFVEVETFTSPKHGPQARGTLLTARITNLIEYVPPTEAEDKAELPA